MPEQFLNTSQICASLEQVGRERVPEQMRVDARRLEPRFGGEPAQDQERSRPCQRSALRVQEELRPVAAVEERPAAGEVTAQRLGGGASDRDDPLLTALAAD